MDKKLTPADFEIMNWPPAYPQAHMVSNLSELKLLANFRNSSEKGKLLISQQAACVASLCAPCATEK